MTRKVIFKIHLIIYQTLKISVSYEFRKIWSEHPTHKKRKPDKDKAYGLLTKNKIFSILKKLKDWKKCILVETKTVGRV